MEVPDKIITRNSDRRMIDVMEKDTITKKFSFVNSKANGYEIINYIYYEFQLSFSKSTIYSS